MNIHEHYDQLTDSERKSLDRAFESLMIALRVDRHPICGDDRSEHAIDAVAKAIISSRK